MTAGFLIIIISSCNKKSDLLDKVPVYSVFKWINKSVLYNYIGLKYNGEAIDLRSPVMAGIGTYTFYDIRTGATLLEKELDLKPGESPWYLFQPDSTVTPQLLKNTEVDEPAAPAGFMKLKIVNLSKTTLTNALMIPYPKLDIVLWASLGRLVNPVTRYDTLYSIGSSLDTAGYRLIKKAKKTATGFDINSYRVSFIDPDTNQEILNAAGTTYMGLNGLGIDAATNKKNVATVYIVDQQRNPDQQKILKGDKYYDVIFQTLFSE